jgi:hypothetical protein
MLGWDLEAQRPSFFWFRLQSCLRSRFMFPPRFYTCASSRFHFWGWGQFGDIPVYLYFILHLLFLLFAAWSVQMALRSFWISGSSLDFQPLQAVTSHKVYSYFMYAILFKDPLESSSFMAFLSIRVVDTSIWGNNTLEGIPVPVLNLSVESYFLGYLASRNDLRQGIIHQGWHLSPSSLFWNYIEEIIG